MTNSRAARSCADYFEIRERDNGGCACNCKSKCDQQFSTLRDNAPAWLKEAVYAAHQGDLPSDWIFDECRVAWNACCDGSLTDDDSLHEYADSRVDVYTQELYRWAADHCLSTTFAAAEETAKEITAADAETQSRLAATQYVAVSFIARVMLDAYVDNITG